VNDPGDEHTPPFVGCVSTNDPVTPSVFVHSDTVTSASPSITFTTEHHTAASLDVGARVMRVQHAYRRASSDPNRSALWRALAFEASCLAVAQDAARAARG